MLLMDSFSQHVVQQGGKYGVIELHIFLVTTVFMDSTLKLPVMQGCVSYTLELSLLARQMIQLLLTKLGF